MTFQATTRSGTPWEQEFVTHLDQSSCIGCGRCYNVCPRDVFDLIEREIDEDDDDYDDYDDQVMMVMELKNEGDCIGCGSCSRVCSKKSLTHTKASMLA
jgi:Nif-specific ferredoxin III